MHISVRFSSTAIVVCLIFSMFVAFGKATIQLPEQSEQRCPPPYDYLRDDVIAGHVKDLQISLAVFSLAEKDKNIGTTIQPFIETIVDMSVFALANILVSRTEYLQSCDLGGVKGNYVIEMVNANERFLELLSRIAFSREFLPIWVKWFNSNQIFICGHGSTCIDSNIIVIKGSIAKRLKKRGKYGQNVLQRNPTIIAARLLLKESDVRKGDGQTFEPTPQPLLSPYGTRLAGMRSSEIFSWWKNLSMPEKFATLSAYYLSQK